MADSTYRVGVRLDLNGGKFRKGARAAASDTDRFGKTLRKAAGSGSLMGRNVAAGARQASRGIGRTDESSRRLGRTFRRVGREGQDTFRSLTRLTSRFRAEMGLATRAAGRLRGGIGGVAALGGGAFAIGSGLRRVISMEERMERLGNQSERPSADMERLRKEVFAAANLPEIRLDPSQLLGAVEAIVEKTGDLDFARDNLLLIAQAIQGSGGTGDAIGRLSAEMRKLDVTDPAGVAQALNLLTAQGKSGAFTLGNMAAQGERLFSAFSRFRYEGPGAVRQLGAIVQMARQSTGSSEQAATAVEALLRSLSDAQKVDSIWEKLGVNVQDPSGAFRPLDRILKEIVRETGGDPLQLSEIFDAEAIRAISGLASQQGRADYERFLTLQAPPDMLAGDAARIARTAGAQVQETRTSFDDLLQEHLTGPLRDVSTALVAMKDEIMTGVGVIAGAWVGFRAVRAGGNLVKRLAGKAPPVAAAGAGASGATGAAAAMAAAGKREAARFAHVAGTQARTGAIDRRAARQALLAEQAARRAAEGRREASRFAHAAATRERTSLVDKLAGKEATGAGKGATRLRGVGTASAGFVLGLTAYDAATGAIPPSEAAPAMAGAASGLAGSSLGTRAGLGAAKFLPGALKIPALVAGGVAGWLGGEKMGRAALAGPGERLQAEASMLYGAALIDPDKWRGPHGPVDIWPGDIGRRRPSLLEGAASASAVARRRKRREEARRADVEMWPDELAGPPEPAEFASDDVARLPTPFLDRATGESPVERRRRRRAEQRRQAEVVVLPDPPDRDHEPEESHVTRRRQRRRRGAGGGAGDGGTVNNTVNIHPGAIVVNSGSADPREVAEEVVDEIERRARDRALELQDGLAADPSPEAEY